MLDDERRLLVKEGLVEKAVLPLLLGRTKDLEDDARPPLRPFLRLVDRLWKLGDVGLGLLKVYRLLSKASPPLGDAKSNKSNSLPDPIMAP